MSAAESRAVSARWNEAAAEVVRKARRSSDDSDPVDAWAALATSTLENVTIPPLGTADRTSTPAPGVRAGRSDTLGWDIRPHLAGTDPQTVGSDALAELEGGATSLLLTVGGPGVASNDISAALTGVHLDLAPVALDIQGAVDEVEAAAALIETVRRLGVSPASGMSLGADPVSRRLRQGRSTGPVVVGNVVAQVAGLASEVGARALVVDATAAHDLGAAEVAELAYSMALGTAYLRALHIAGFAPEAGAPMIEFRYAATADQFLTIAKLRAARALWRRVLQLCSVSNGRLRQYQHAVSSRPMMTRYDPWMNILRGTVAAFAAGVGGADAVTVLPFDAMRGVPHTLGRRLARNTSSLLISEAHVAQVDDPAGGAYAVEMLTDELAQCGWAEFQRIEKAGGIYAAIADGSLTAGFRATAAERRRRVADRRFPVTGVTEFPDLGAQLLPADTAPGTDHDRAPRGWAAEFEELRDEAGGGRMFMATLGPQQDHNARAMFAANALAVAGIAVERSASGLDTAALTEAFARSGCGAVCVAGTDAAYQHQGAALVSALRHAGARWVILTGRPSTELSLLIDDHLAAGEDLLGLLRRAHDHLPREGRSR